MMLKALVAFLLVSLLVVGGLAFYGSASAPATRSIEQVLPDSGFPK